MNKDHPAYKQGKEAFFQHKWTAPYALNTPHFHIWERGFLDAYHDSMSHRSAGCDAFNEHIIGDLL